MLLRGENPASLFLFPGAQDWPPDPWPLGQRQGLASSPHQMPSRAGAGRAGGVTTLSRPPEGARCQCAWALPAMTGPPLSLAHLLTLSGLLCYSACCLGELCVCVCVFVLRVALEKKKKKTLGKPSCSGELPAAFKSPSPPLVLELLCKGVRCWSSCNLGSHDCVCPSGDPGWQAGSCPLGSEAAWYPVVRGHPGMGGREVLQPSPGQVLRLTAVP